MGVDKIQSVDELVNEKGQTLFMLFIKSQKHQTINEILRVYSKEMDPN